jgi:beta-phosphoglucomutase-like phosphatase (HAD superfamily)
MAGIKAGLAAGCMVVAVGDVAARRVSGRIADFRDVRFREAGDGELYVDLGNG